MNATRDEIRREQIIQAAMRVNTGGYHPDILRRAQMLARLGAAGHDIEAIYKDPYFRVPKELIIKAGREMGLI